MIAVVGRLVKFGGAVESTRSARQTEIAGSLHLSVNMSKTRLFAHVMKRIESSRHTRYALQVSGSGK